MRDSEFIKFALGWAITDEIIEVLTKDDNANEENVDAADDTHMSLAWQGIGDDFQDSRYDPQLPKLSDEKRKPPKIGECMQEAFIKVGLHAFVNLGVAGELATDEFAYKSIVAMRTSPSDTSENTERTTVHT